MFGRCRFISASNSIGIGVSAFISSLTELVYIDQYFNMFWLNNQLQEPDFTLLGNLREAIHLFGFFGTVSRFRVFEKDIWVSVYFHRSLERSQTAQAEVSL
jgi:hypothetical protein